MTPSKLPYKLLASVTQLNSSVLERKTENVFQYNSHSALLEKLGSEEVFVDLSLCKWASVEALTQLTLQIEWLRKQGITVFVALPLKRSTRKDLESTSYPEAVRLVNEVLRAKCNKFLKMVEFDDVLRCTHIKSKGAVYVTEEYEYNFDYSNNIDEFYSLFEEDSAIEDYRGEISAYPNIVPMTWVKATPEGVSKIYEDRFDTVLASERKGLENLDVAALKNVILNELLKNVYEHSGEDSNYALVALGLFDWSRNWDKLDVESKTTKVDSSFMKWVKEDNIESIVELYFGDSGNGILESGLKGSYKTSQAYKSEASRSKITDEKLLQWSFDKWSTRKVDEQLRGTKGLYRVLRIVNRYNGIITLRTGNLNSGFQKGGKSNLHWVSKHEENKQPGTLVSVKLCPYKELFRTNFTLGKNLSRQNWKSLSLDVTNHLSTELEKQLEQCFRADSRVNYLIILNIEFYQESWLVKKYLERVLPLISAMRHPQAVFVFINNPISNAEMEGIIDSTNALILQDAQDLDSGKIDDNVFDPVLVVSGGIPYWYGGEPDLVDLLNEAADLDSFKSLDQLHVYKEIDPERQTKLRMHLRNENAILALSSDNDVEVNCTNIKVVIDDYLESALQLKKVEYDSTVVSPKLSISKEWYPVAQIVENDPALIAFALFLTIVEQNINYDSDTRVLIDHNQHLQVAEALVTYLQIPSRNIVRASDSISKTGASKTELFLNNQKVIVVSSVVSSSQTVTSLVKYVLKDRAKLQGIIALLNNSDNIDVIKVWGQEFRVHSVIDYSSKRKERNNDSASNLLRQLDRSQNYISPTFNHEKALDVEHLKNLYLLDQSLKELIISTKSLHYNHIGLHNNRHFTFYLNKNTLLSSKSVLWEKCIQAILNWKRDSSIGNLTLYWPKPHKEKLDALRGLVRYLKDNVPGLKVITVNSSNIPVIEDDAVIYLDFGSLTGATMNALLSKLRNTEQILFCLLFSQFQSNEHELYRRVKNIEIPSIPTNYGQTTLFEVDNLNHKPIVANVSYQFLFDFPLEVYRFSNCPICISTSYFEIYSIYDQFQNEFYQDRKNRLKIRDRAEVGDTPADFYSDSEGRSYELSSELIMSMFEFWRLLKLSVHLTQGRIELYRQLVGINEHIEDQLVNPSSKLYALLYLLSNEPYWLNKEPLMFQIFRRELVDISLNVVKLGVEELKSIFDNSAISGCPTLNLAVRYKYAAISVMRASSKYAFCSNIFNILKNSFYSGRISHNLAQNTFYNIYTLLKNSYNKNDKCFKALSSQFDQIFTAQLITEHRQKSIAYELMLNNRARIVELEEEFTGEFKDRQAVKYFKRSYKALYQTESHPVHYSKFTVLDFRPLGDGKSSLEDVVKLGVDSDYYTVFNAYMKSLQINWYLFRQDVEPIVQAFLNSVSNDLLHSELFNKSRFQQQVSNLVQNQNGRLSSFARMTEIINKAHEDLSHLRDAYNEYHGLYEQIFKNIVQYKIKEDQTSNDNLVLNLLSDFPTDVLEIANSVFPKQKFEKLKIVSKSDDQMVFYPRSVLLEKLSHIPQNMRQRLPDGVYEKDVTIGITYFDDSKDKNYSILQIAYSGTNGSEKKGNVSGGLSILKKDISLYGGTVNFFEDGEKFIINLKFLKYE